MFATLVKAFPSQVSQLKVCLSESCHQFALGIWPVDFVRDDALGRIYKVSELFNELNDKNIPIYENTYGNLHPCSYMQFNPLSFPVLLSKFFHFFVSKQVSK